MPWPSFPCPCTDSGSVSSTPPPSELPRSGSLAPRKDWLAASCCLVTAMVHCSGALCRPPLSILTMSKLSKIPAAEASMGQTLLMIHPGIARIDIMLTKTCWTEYPGCSWSWEQSSLCLASLLSSWSPSLTSLHPRLWVSSLSQRQWVRLRFRPAWSRLKFLKLQHFIRSEIEHF